jgi:glycosyltransferase involved in cell wall biosynthesis
MKFTLIVCTYKRRKALQNLLDSVKKQSLYPNEILIIDGSPDDETKYFLENYAYKNLKYYKVTPENRGLTKQRNFGIANVCKTSEVVCFLDDDIILFENYFEDLIGTYALYPNALAVGGYIINGVTWKKVSKDYAPNVNEFYYDEYVRVEPLRFKLRKKLKLDSNTSPGFSPSFSHGRSVGFLPPSGKIYPVEQLMGGVSSFKKEVFQTLSFSNYFEGYGLYEDADFSIRLAQKGELYINTKAQLEHHHDEAGRPNKYQFGKMVVRNGWYVWRVKNATPNIIDRYKWNAITLLLLLIRGTNIITTNKKREAFTETIGRIAGWFSLFYNKPKQI